MEVPQDTKPVETLPKNIDNASVHDPSPNKSKGEESDVQTSKKSRDEKNRKKDDKNVEQFFKALNTLGTSEEKLAAMCKKYSDLYDENRKLQTQVKQTEKRCAALQRVKDQLQSEQSKVILTRTRLESLCRELQKQNKAIKEESLLKISEEEEKRKVVSAKFQTALSEITALMQQNSENYTKLKEENLEIQNKFKTLCEQYELKEQQVEKLTKQMQLESQLADVKIAKVKIDMFAEKELLTNEKEQLLAELTAYQNKCQATEVALRSHMTMYSEKFDEFQNTLAKSNQIYSNFKAEIEKMSKKISKLEKETSVWKMKWEGSRKALLQMAAEKQQRDGELALTTKQLNQLEKLCRTLLSERTSLIAQLKSEGYTPKLGDGNEESTIEKLSIDKIINESQSQDSNQISSIILDENEEKIEDSSTDMNNKINVDDIDKSEEMEKEEALKSENDVTQDSVTENIDSIMSHVETDEIVRNEVTNHDQLVKEDENLKTEDGNNLKDLDNSNLELLSTPLNDNGKKEQEQVCAKLPSAHEPKKGKDASRKRKK